MRPAGQLCLHRTCKRLCLRVPITRSKHHCSIESQDPVREVRRPSFGRQLSAVTDDPTLGELRQQVASVFPEFPASIWKNAFYFERRRASGSPSVKVPLHNAPKPRFRLVERVPDGVLSAYRRPPPGLDDLTVNLDREAFRTVKDTTEIRRVLRVHFAACLTATDVLHVVALATQREPTRAQLGPIHMRIIQALFRSRERVSDQRICTALRVIIQRMLVAGLEIPYELYACGLKFSARSRELEKIRWFLAQFRRENLQMSRNLFRSVIAKCGIGHRGFGEIRNGKWDLDDLRQILFGFDMAETAAEEHAHLEAWLERHDWHEVHAWLQILAVVGAKDKAIEEWKLWKCSPRRDAEALWRTPRHPTPVSTKLRGDSWFIRVMIRFGELETAWEVLLGNPSVWVILEDEVRALLKSYGERNHAAMEKLKYAMSPVTEGRRASII